jgi:hypothetical protein
MVMMRLSMPIEDAPGLPCRLQSNASGRLNHALDKHVDRLVALAHAVGAQQHTKLAAIVERGVVGRALLAVRLAALFLPCGWPCQACCEYIQSIDCCMKGRVTSLSTDRSFLADAAVIWSCALGCLWRLEGEASSAASRKSSSLCASSSVPTPLVMVVAPDAYQPLICVYSATTGSASLVDAISSSVFISCASWSSPPASPASVGGPLERAAGAGGLEVVANASDFSPNHWCRHSLHA